MIVEKNCAMRHILAMVSRFVLVTLFGMTQTSCFMYGTPEAEYEFKGKVMDEGSLPIKDIQVTVQSAAENNQEFLFTTTTDGSGDFEFKTRVITNDFPEKVKVIFEDTDGLENRGEYAKDSLLIGTHQVKKADGWYKGGFVSDDVNMYLKRIDI